MLSIDLQARIFKEYHTGKEFTKVHTWVVRQDKSGGAWEWVQPLAYNMQFTPHSSVKAVKACI